MSCCLVDPWSVRHVPGFCVDRYILQTALDEDGIVVSNDNYRDLHKEKQFKKIIEERILMYSFANDRWVERRLYLPILSVR